MVVGGEEVVLGKNLNLRNLHTHAYYPMINHHNLFVSLRRRELEYTLEHERIQREKEISRRDMDLEMEREEKLREREANESARAKERRQRNQELDKCNAQLMVSHTLSSSHICPVFQRMY